MSVPTRIDGARLWRALQTLGEIGALPGGGVCRLAATDEDKAGRAHLIERMRALGLEVAIDAIGNIRGLRPGAEPGPPVMMGSHIDTVATGGLYDGALGVLAGLEVVERLNECGVETARPLAVAAFSNEEGARFPPDMMGSGVAQGALDLIEMLAATDADGVVFGEELRRIGYVGDASPSAFDASAFIELHIEQGPVLEREGFAIGAVTGVQGISWTEFTISGQSNHAGTTPMAMRRDAGVVAARIAVTARDVADAFGPPQVATVGVLSLTPGLVNVVPAAARITVDLRNTDDEQLREAERRVEAAAKDAAAAEGCGLEMQRLARFAPVEFDEKVIAAVESAAGARGLSVRRMPSGAGHDAQMYAPNCPTGTIFVPSKDGLSHNIAEYTAPDEIEAGANVLLDVILQLAGIRA